jgi:cysteinyl-tRNA synthetase
MHNEWVLVDNKKMAKSFQNFYTLRDIIKREINPLAYRFWLLMANYRTRVNFVWEALEGAETALKRLYGLYLELLVPSEAGGSEIGHVHKEYQHKFKEYIEDDLDTPRALSLLWDVFKDENISNVDKKATILDFDKVFGLGFEKLKEEKIPEEIEKLGEKREQERKNQKWERADEIRKEIENSGYYIDDSTSGPRIHKK